MLIQDSTALAQTVSDPSAARNILDIIGLAGGFQYPILIVFVLGIGSLMHTLVRIYQDKRQATALLNLDLGYVKTADLRSAAELSGQSIYHLLLRGLVQRTQVDSDHTALTRTVTGILRSEQEASGLTHKVVDYCSSAAGGLGLAGTMVGIYSTFSAGSTDPSTLFVGIALALISTLLGVAASLILEAADTFVSRYATKYHAHGREWGEAVAMRLSQLRQASLRVRRSKKSGRTNAKSSKP